MEFEALQDLIEAITRNKLKDLDVLGLPGDKGSRTDQLYDGISRGKLKSDDEAAQFMFGTNAKDVKYKRLRQRLIRQLVNSVFFIDSTKTLFSDYGTAYISCYRDFAAAMLLRGSYQPKAGVYLLLQTLEQATRWELTYLCAEITRILRNEFGRTAEDRQNRDKYSQLHRQWEEKRRWEIQALDSFETLLDHFIARQSPTTELHEQASACYAELVPQLEQVNTTMFYYHTGSIGLIKFISGNEFEEALGLADRLLAIFSERQSINRSSVAAVAFQRLLCLLQLRRFDDGAWEEAHQYVLDLIEPNSYNWFRFKEFEYYYYLYTRQYQSALEVYKETVTNPKFNRLVGRPRDDWRLYDGYMHLLVQLGQLDAAELESVSGPFKLSRFLNDFEVLNKDKEGMNIPLLMLPILYNLAIGNTEELGRSTDALGKYRQRYLNNDLNRRSSSFLKILLAFCDLPYEKAAATRKIEKELSVLQELKPETNQQLFLVEIIPYEDLFRLLKEKHL